MSDAIVNEESVREFLQKHPNPKIVRTNSIKVGYVSLISPVPTMFGAEMHVSYDSFNSLQAIVLAKQGDK